ncbi:MAG TPA: tyrosinase family protein [Pseudoxanthomonas sp.]|nr:tyrosinase family protein [Pseudoxanthomonas sp.]
MNKITRRQFAGGLAASALILQLPQLKAQQRSLLTRYDAASDIGREMLDIYAFAVNRMMQLYAGNPQSWVWQWYTHAVHNSTTKNIAIDWIFGFNPLRSLANEMWDTCPHRGEDPFYFLPWHRMYVFYFEEIVRQISGVSSFTLPYWNYTSPDPVKRGIVPVQFRNPRSPLFRFDRNPLANSGSAITGDQAVDVMDIRNVMGATEYINTEFVQGFGTRIDTGIHGIIHTLVGTATNMGSVPSAAGDPLFWVHHANVDRMWASWNAAGRSNPAGTQQGTTQFVFADGGGARRLARVDDYLSTEQLGYTYDTLIALDGTEASPPLNTAMRTRSRRSATGAAPSRTPTIIARSSEAVTIGSKPVQVTLVPNGRIAEADASQRYFLLLRNLQASSQPGVVYHIYLTPGIAPPEKSNYVGSLTFFGATSGQGGHSPPTGSVVEPLYSFDVTDLLSAINDWGPIELVKVTIVPNGNPASHPTIGAIELGAQ